jgi:hypothetical protein
LSHSGKDAYFAQGRQSPVAAGVSPAVEGGILPPGETEFLSSSPFWFLVNISRLISPQRTFSLVPTNESA